jgi:hypothetical protein
MISMLLVENPAIELTDMDGTNLVRMLQASAKKAVGERIVPAMDNRKLDYNKTQKVLMLILCIICCLPYVSMTRSSIQHYYHALVLIWCYWASTLFIGYN